MGTLVNSIPQTIKVGETPIKNPISTDGVLTSTWNKWLSTIGTYLTKSQENKSGSFVSNGSTIGSWKANRVGNVITLNGSFVAGTYSGITVTGAPVAPLENIPVLVIGGTASMDTDGKITLSASSESTILLAASYLASVPKES